MAEEVIHAFGWVPQPVDDRDVEYVPRRWTLLALPPSHSLDDPTLPAPWRPVFNQGSLGSCGPQTTGKNVVFTQLKRDGSAVVPSRLFHYYNTRALMGTIGQDSGVDNRNMLKALAKWGWCDETLWPYNISKFTQKPPDAAYQAATNNLTAIKYMSVPQNEQTIKACLVETGRPIICGFAVYQNMLTPAVDASGVIPMPSGNQVGGHDVLIYGYDNARRVYFVMNSWGEDWGIDGCGTIPFDFVHNPALAGDFWSVVEAESDVPAPPPVDPPTPVPDCPTACATVRALLSIFNDFRHGKPIRFLENTMLTVEDQAALTRAAAIVQALPCAGAGTICAALAPLLGGLCPTTAQGQAALAQVVGAACQNAGDICKVLTTLPQLIEQLKPILDALMKTCPPKS